MSDEVVFGGETMTCTQCHKEIDEHSNFCSYCGARLRPAFPHRRLMRSSTDVKIAGVCGGLAEYLNVDPTIVRLFWAILAVVPGGVVGGDRGLPCGVGDRAEGAAAGLRADRSEADSGRLNLKTRR